MSRRVVVALGAVLVALVLAAGFIPPDTSSGRFDIERTEMARKRRPGTGQQGKPTAGAPAPGAWSPFTSITWRHAAWASDPAQTAPADGAALLGWRDNAGGAFSSGASPIMETASTVLNGKARGSSTGPRPSSPPST
jgi:hypothetical protein